VSKDQCKDIAHAFSYMNEIDCVTLETDSVVAWYTTVGGQILNSSETLTIKAGF
jgi:hypothetical protein